LIIKHVGLSNRHVVCARYVVLTKTHAVWAV